MEIFTLVGKMTIEGMDKSKSQLGDLEKKTQQVQKGLKVMGAAFTAVGVAGLALIQSTKAINAQLGVTALSLGITIKEMRALTLATTNVTFPIDEVRASFDMLARAGVKDTEVLKSTATAFDTLGDAIGMSASQVTDIMVPAMKTFRLSAEEVASKTDMMTFMVRNSTISLEDFNTMVGYTSQEMVDAGLTIDDMAAAMMFMSDSGVEPGKVMLREWNKAVTKSQKEGIALTEALGMTSEELERYKSGLEGATGMTQRFADVANEQYTIMDKLKQKLSELTLGMSGFLEPLEPVLVGMTALGPLLIAVAMNAKLSAIAVRAFGVAWKVASGPIGWAAIAIGAVVAAMVVMNSAFTKTELSVEDLTDALKDSERKLNELKDAGKGMSDEAISLRARIAALTSSLEGLNVVIGDSGTVEADWQDTFSKRERLISDIEKAERSLAKTTGLTPLSIKMRKDALAGLTIELYKNDTALAGLVAGTDDLSDAYRNATPEQIRFLDVIVMEAYELEQAAKAENYRLDVLKDTAREEIRLVEDARDARLDAFDAVADKARETHRERIKQIEDEYRLSLSDIERGIQDQIDAIDNLTETEDDAERERQDLKRVAELKAAIAEEGDADRRAKLEEQLTDQLARIERWHLLQSRDAQKDALREELQGVRDGTDVRAIELAKQRDQKIAAAEEERERHLGELKQERKDIEEHYANLLEEAEQQVTDINAAYEGLKTSYEIEIVTYHKDVYEGEGAAPSGVGGGGGGPAPTPMLAGGIAMRETIARIGENAPRVPELILPLDSGTLAKYGIGGGFKTANIIVMLDRTELGRVMFEPLVEEILLKTGFRR